MDNRYALPLAALCVVSMLLMGARQRTDLEQYQDALADELPNVLECDNFSWMEGCEIINRQAKLNPTAPIRVMDQTGLEFNFAPGTPSVVIQHMLNPSKANARKVFNHNQAHMQRAQLAADFGQQVQLEAGGDYALYTKASLKGMAGPKQSPALIDESAYTLFVFYRSDNKASLDYLVEVADLAESYPNLRINVLQADDNDEMVKRVKDTLGLRVKQLTGSEKRKLLPRVTEFPSTWLQANRSSKTTIMTGAISAASIERALLEGV